MAVMETNSSSPSLDLESTLLDRLEEQRRAFLRDGPPTAIRIAAFCRGLLDGLQGTLKSGLPIYLVFDHDLAGLVGAILKEEYDLKNEILSIDGVTLRDCDYIDLGKVLEPSGTVPVTIKSLVFQM